MLTDQTRWSLGHGNPLVPSRWQATTFFQTYSSGLSSLG
jgi:hypothetical protein